MWLDPFFFWSVFWTSYWGFGIFFPRNYKTKTKHLRFQDMIRLVQKNMIWTLLFQYAFWFAFRNCVYDPQNVVYRFVLCALITEVLFWSLHKMFHIRMLYPYHKIHHDFVEPCALSAMYCHPLEAIFCNQLAVILGPIITGMTFHQKIAWAIIVAINTLKAHSGLRITGFNSRYHDIHHKINYANYGFLYLPDIFYGSAQIPNYKNKLRNS